ncbi:KilA-N domain-containing protein [Rhizobium sp. VS19-DR104.2]|uniref:KilA-N domain-containing protein n=1 Tax=unclassified Rhizobium TaxID=2613769 RepID=UPI001CC69ECE|nr:MULTISPECIES: KilA-N domain-containing protein [unclassified Rhizobium]MBZ5757975.1 KilA-N domain-containing protein [Rhizobium sp. VS19-DR96]MBZ5765195.1 KilA-N domain-containing protein [Rhizobium sp. VS19-DR129.2]MBZ5772738.1 KilA-N domain-containing protein [Rhizobium sp. VS19-DRK62.2]MBZ5782575.1 KilA-N domain-containing protein [Rhizobium sp. VS19-DR121]MBZ5800023.1 KilA-N domain-containing protein [Rhizobium sp. VS19-DR181]
MPEMKIMLFKKTKIRVDENGLVCLNDIHTAAGFSKNQTPADWQRLPSYLKEYPILLKKITGKSRDWTKEEARSVAYSKKGVGTWVHENLALSYAAYLSPALAIDIRDVFLRFKKGDETLHEEIRLNKAARDTVREEHRDHGKRVRKSYTDTLKNHGVQKWFEYANCTNEAYKHLFGGTAKELKLTRRLHPKANLRDHMSLSELAYTMAAEALAVERIEHEEAAGYIACKTETRMASQSISLAIEADRRNRQKRLV